MDAGTTVVIERKKNVFVDRFYVGHNIEKPNTVILPAFKIMSKVQPTNNVKKLLFEHFGIRRFRCVNVSGCGGCVPAFSNKIGNGQIGGGPTHFLFNPLSTIQLFVSLVDFSLWLSKPVYNCYFADRERGGVSKSKWWMYYKNGIEHFQFSEFA